MITEYQKIECFKYIIKKLRELDKVTTFEFIMMTLEEELRIHPELLGDSPSELYEHLWGVIKMQLHYRNPKTLSRTL
jgi:hypothetical protein